MSILYELAYYFISMSECLTSSLTFLNLRDLPEKEIHKTKQIRLKNVEDKLKKNKK